METNGAGYSSAPTVAFYGGGGSGAAGTAYLGEWAYQDRQLRVSVVGGAVTFANGTNVQLAPSGSSTATIAADGSITFNARAGKMYEVARAA
jgi:hypothetical protein